jgi:hypothetical protein
MVDPIGGLLPPIPTTSPPEPVAQAGAPAIAASSNTVLAVWAEGLVGEGGFESVPHLEAALIAPPRVTRLDLGEGASGYTRPDVASDGEDFLIVWRAHSAERAPTPYGVRGRRFGPGPGPLDASAGFPIAEGARVLREPRVAFGADEYLVVWMEASAETDDVPPYALRAARISPAGTVASGPTTLATDLSSSEIAVASNGDHFLVVYSRAEQADVVALSGLLLDARRARSPPSVTHP